MAAADVPRLMVGRWLSVARRRVSVDDSEQLALWDAGSQPGDVANDVPAVSSVWRAGERPIEQRVVEEEKRDELVSGAKAR